MKPGLKRVISTLWSIIRIIRVVFYAIIALVVILLFCFIIWFFIERSYPTTHLPNGLHLSELMWYREKFQGKDADSRYAILNVSEEVVPPHVRLVGWSDQAVFGIRKDPDTNAEEYYIYQIKEKQYHAFPVAKALDAYMAAHGMEPFSQAEKYSSFEVLTSQEIMFLIQEQKLKKQR